MSEKFNIFGKPHSVTGESLSDLILRTKGNIKILWGNKFIDLLKDGKINVDTDFIFQGDSIGIKDGIYVTPDKVILKIGDQEIDLTKEDANTYVSFQVKLETNSDLKYQALTNIGFIYNDLDSITEDSLLNGIIYVESELKLYIVKDGELTAYTLELPNPYPKQFVIAKNDKDVGSLVIKGKGINNSLVFDDFKIYSEGGNFVVNADNLLVFKVRNLDVIKVDMLNTTINNNVNSNYFGSIGANSELGFRLYLLGNESTLEVDNLIVRNKTDEPHPVYPNYWFNNLNIITSAESAFGETEATEELLLNSIKFNLYYPNTYSVGDVVHAFIRLDNYDETTETTKITQSIIMYKVTSVAEYSVTGEYLDIVKPNPRGTLDSDELYKRFANKTIFLHNFADESNKVMIAYASNGFSWEHGADPLHPTLLAKLGDLSDINTSEGREKFYYIDKKEDVELEGKDGVYGKCGIFEEALYNNKYVLAEDDDSSRFASTEWVNVRDQILKELLEAELKELEDKINEIGDEINDSLGEINNSNLDLYFNSKTANVSTTESWVSSNSELKKVIEGATTDASVISGKRGQITLQKSGDLVHVVAWVAAVTDDDTTSHRSFEFDINPSTYSITGLSTYILFTRYPGYYLSKSKSGSNPVDFYYVGTSKLNPTSTYQYLWNWDGIQWSLVDTYTSDENEYIFIRTTHLFNYQNLNEGKYYYLPGGFICYMNGSTETEVGFGKSNFILITSLRKLEETKTRLRELKGKLSSPASNSKPSNTNYPYLWCILKDDDMTDPDKWMQVGSGPTSFSLSLDYPKRWGNCSTPSPYGYSLVKTDSSGKMTGTDIGINFKSGIGNIENWKDKIWVESFIRHALSWILYANRNYYNPVIGWNFRYNEEFFTGAGGYIHVFFNEPTPPTSDDPSSIEYYPQMGLYQIAGTVSGYGYSSQFLFNGLKLGKLIENVGMGQDLEVGNYCPFYNFLYLISFQSYYAKVIDFANKTEELITG